MGLYKLPKLIGIDKKPSFGARVNLFHPLSQGLVAAWLFNEGGGNIAFDASEKQSCNGSVGSLIQWKDTGVYFPSNNLNSSITIGTPPILASLQAPMTLIGSFIRIGSGGAVFAQYFTVDPHKLIKMVRLDSNNLTYYYDQNTGNYGSYGDLPVTADIITNYAVVVSGSISGATCDIYVNSAHQSASIGALDASPDTTVKIYFGRSEAWDVFKGIILNHAIYNRALSAIEVYEYFANPYQMFLPVVWDAYYVPAAAPPPTGGRSIFGYDSIFHAGGIIQT